MATMFRVAPPSFRLLRRSRSDRIVTCLTGSTQRNVAFANWTLDAFDFFILVFVLSELAHYFHTSVSDVSLAIMLTLAVRPIGALLFAGGALRAQTDSDAEHCAVFAV